MKKSFITEDLRIDYLEKEFHFDEFVKAINDGVIQERIVKCAADMHDGDVMTVLRAVNKCVDSKRCNLKKSQQSKSIVQETKRMDMFKDYLVSLYPVYTNKSVARSAGGNKPYYAVTFEEIADISLDDTSTLQSIYDCMASLKSKYPERIEDMAEFEARRIAVRDRLKMSKDKAKGVPVHEDETVLEISDELVDKLTSEKGASLTKAQVAELRRVLGIK